METDNIKILLDKYWAGESSMEEERSLKEYFSNDQVDPAFEAIRPLFAFYKQQGEITMASEINHKPRVEPVARIHNLRWLINVAATVLVFIALFFANRYQDERATETYIFTDTYDDPKVAYQEVKEALLFVSAKMNKGLSKADQSLDKMEPLDNILN
ncbi:MAG: hypothetical protein HKN87_00420 [Saprospiraceae bacterium]|nr:hypothetical protein [Saprospiraceae bacterium]